MYFGNSENPTCIDLMLTNTAHKMKFFINIFFSKCDQIGTKSYLLSKSFMKNFILYAM